MTSPRTFEARSAAAMPVGVSINELERSINTSFIKLGELFTNIGKARLDPAAHMPLSIGMAAGEKAAQMAVAIAAAYRASVETHAELATDKAALGLKTVAWGDYWDTFSAFDAQRIAAHHPEPGPVDLRAVA